MFIADVEPPQIMTCATTYLQKVDFYQHTAVVVWQDPVATDNSGDVPKITCNPQSGTEFPIGITTVECIAVDGNGNTAGCSFDVEVGGICKGSE